MPRKHDEIQIFLCMASLLNEDKNGPHQQVSFQKLHSLSSNTDRNLLKVCMLNSELPYCLLPTSLKHTGSKLMIDFNRAFLACCKMNCEKLTIKMKMNIHKTHLFNVL